jgi:hypothetical protein
MTAATGPRRSTRPLHVPGAVSDVRPVDEFGRGGKRPTLEEGGPARPVLRPWS